MKSKLQVYNSSHALYNSYRGALNELIYKHKRYELTKVTKDSHVYSGDGKNLVVLVEDDRAMYVYFSNRVVV